MLDPARLDQVLRRGAALKPLVDEFRAVDASRKELQGRLDALRARRNEANDRMAKADKKSPEFATLRDEMRQVSQQVKEGEAQLADLEERARDRLLHVPNAPHETVPAGGGEQDNPVVSTWGEQPSFSFTPKDHVDLGVARGIMDFERAA